jgi:hypothetical protein
VTETVIRGLLVGVLQDVIGLVRFLELGLGVGVVGVAVGVEFLGLLRKAFLISSPDAPRSIPRTS